MGKLPTTNALFTWDESFILQDQFATKVTTAFSKDFFIDLFRNNYVHSVIQYVFLPVLDYFLEQIALSEYLPTSYFSVNYIVFETIIVKEITALQENRILSQQHH
ncbi:hypothetical protein ABEB36_010284 [Hypothenemus hampei]|uniref:Uncharacterized protein n=1 Tax=Hypothenemus hampei TaxID=57062 RepID=A0ABD1EJ47_HYPHA